MNKGSEFRSLIQIPSQQLASCVSPDKLFDF